MSPNVVHFAIVDLVRRVVAPLCGEWQGATNWTTAPTVVTCPSCLEALREQTRRGGPSRAGAASLPASANA